MTHILIISIIGINLLNFLSFSKMGETILRTTVFEKRCFTIKLLVSPKPCRCKESSSALCTHVSHSWGAQFRLSDIRWMALNVIERLPMATIPTSLVFGSILIYIFYWSLASTSFFVARSTWFRGYPLFHQLHILLLYSSLLFFCV